MAAIETALRESNVQFQAGTGALDTVGVPPEVAKRIAALPPGEPFLVPQNGQLVASVIKSATAVPEQPQQAKPAAIELIRRQSVDKAMRKQLAGERSSAKIEYAPGFAPPPKPPTPVGAPQP